MKKISTSVDDASDKDLRAWIETLTPVTQIQKNFAGVQFNILTGFHFTNCVTVNIDPNFIWSDNFWLTIGNQEIIISRSRSEDRRINYLSEDDDYGDCFGYSIDRFIIHPIDVDGPILINDNEDSFEIFLCLRNPPSFFVDDDLAPFDFASRSFNLYFERNKPIESDVLHSLLNTLQNFSMDIYNVCHLKKKSEKIAELEEVINSRDTKSFVKSFMVKTWHSKHAAVLPTVLLKDTVDRFHACTSITVLQMLLDITIPTRFQNVNVQLVKDAILPFPESKPPVHYAMIARVKITPTRIIYKQMLPMQTNRIFRYFPDPENFLMVSFVDEHDGNPWRSNLIYEHYLNVLKKGICIAGKRFTFLGCSNSQLREAHCWFSCLDRHVVYNKIGTFPDNWSAGRKLSRLALAFASSIDTVPLNHDRYLRNVAPDIETNSICFSDGIGKGSKKLFGLVRNILNLPQPVSAFQIRVGGVKGVISIFEQQDDVTFRQSMKKFESQHNVLEILGYSRSIKLTLNRHVILMLSSFGVCDDVFLDLQYDELAKCMEALTHNEKSLGFVQSRSQIFDWAMFPAQQIVNEPFFRQILVNNVIESVSYLVDHAHVSVEKGRVLMGVLDETGSLNYGEVYAHVIEEEFDMEIEGQVLVYRNPCVLPSDIRLLTARTANLSAHFKELYRNCLVIPSQGKASHAAECSGGDLDGDLYYIIWDKQLIPPDLESPGEEVVALETILLSPPSTENSDEDMMRFFCDYVSKNRLGMIANAHLASSDKLGMQNPISVQLARYVTAETDAPKKGLTVGPLAPGLMPTEYPDYMCKRDKPSYRSDTVLGEMYRQAYPLLEVLMEKRILLNPPTRMTLNISDHKTIENYYTIYSFEILKLMQSFDLESEVDLFSGTPIWRRGYMSAYKQQTQLRETVQEVVSCFWKKWQEKFDEWREEIENDQQQILEWYRRPKSAQSKVHSFSLLAIPYVKFEENCNTGIAEKMHLSTMRYIWSNKLKWGGEWRLRNNVGKTIMQKLEGVECHFYGSSMLGLNEEYSDIDIYASDKNLKSLSDKLLAIDADLTIKKKPHSCISLTYETLAVDVTNFIGGVKKTYALAETFDEHPDFWPALRVLIEWGRTVRLVKSGGSEGIMTVVSFCHLFIYYTTDESLRTTSEARPYTLARLNNWIESLHGSSCGKYIYEFLKMACNRKNKDWIASKKDPLSGEPLIKSDLIEELNKNAEIALYILNIHEGDIMKLFQFCTKKRVYRILKKYMNPRSSSEAQVKVNLREIKKKCNPKKYQDLTFDLLVRNGQFFLEVTGDHKYFFFVEQGLNRIHSKIISARVYGHRRLNAYHIVNGTIIIPEYSLGIDTELAFAAYEKTHYQAQHTGLMKSVMKIRNVSLNDAWRELEYKRFSVRFSKQKELFESKRRNSRKGSRVWRFFGEMCKYHLFMIDRLKALTLFSFQIVQFAAVIIIYSTFRKHFATRSKQLH